MGISRRRVNFFYVLILLLFFSTSAFAQSFRIAVMESEEGASEKYLPLVRYLKTNGVDATFVPAKNYIHASKMFESDQADGMFSSASIAGILIIKEVAYPVARPLTKKGWSTSWTVVIGGKGSPKFEENAAYFKDKRVAFTTLDLSGDFFFRAIQGSADAGATITSVESHSAAVEALSRGVADIAIINNRAWDEVKAKYPGLDVVGEGSGKSPEMTLILSKKTDISVTTKVKDLLLSFGKSRSPEAKLVKKSLNIKGYIETTMDDFKYAVSVLEKAGVTK